MDHNPPPPPPYSEIPIVRPKKYRALTSMPPPPYHRAQRRKRVTLADVLHTQPDEYIQIKPGAHDGMWRVQSWVNICDTFRGGLFYKSQFRSSFYLVLVFADGDTFRIHSSELTELFNAGEQFMKYIVNLERNPAEP
eukprot:110742_1